MAAHRAVASAAAALLLAPLPLILATASASASTAPRAGAAAVDEALVTGTGDYDAACAVAGDSTHMAHLTIAGTAPSFVIVGSSIPLSGQHWNVAVPGSVIAAAVAGGSVAGGDRLTGSITPTLLADNTAERSLALGRHSVVFSPVALLAPAAPGPIAASFDVADSSWTATGGSAGFRPGDVAVSINAGSVVVSMTCQPTTTHAIVTTAVSPGVIAASQSSTALSQGITVPLIGAPTAVTPAPAPALPTQPTSVAGVVIERGKALATTGTSGLLWGEVAVALALIEVGWLFASIAAPRHHTR